MVQYTFQDALNSHTHWLILAKLLAKDLLASNSLTKAGVLPCTVDRNLARSSVIHTNSVVSWRPRLMPSKTEIDSCVTLGPIVPQPQLSSYMCFSLLLFLSLVHLSTPLHLVHMMGCDHWAIEMQPELHHHCFNQKHLLHWAPPLNYPILYANTRKMIIKKAEVLSPSKLSVFLLPFSHFLLLSLPCSFFLTSYKYFSLLFSMLLSSWVSEDSLWKGN